METVRRQPQTHGGSSPIHHHHARERSRQVWRGSPVAGHSLSREFHRFAIESGIVCVTAVPGIGFRSQAPPTPAAAVPRHPNEHDAGPPSRGCRLALGLGWGRQPPPQRHRSLAVVVLEAFTHRRDRPDPERSPGVAWHKRQNVIKLGSHIPPPMARCSPCTLSVWSGTTPNREK